MSVERDVIWIRPLFGRAGVPLAVIAIITVIGLIAAGCGGESSDEEQIEQVANEWAPLFARGDEAMCEYAKGGLVDACRMGIYIDGSPSPWMRSFENATVERVKIDDGEAVVWFSNDDWVEFVQQGDEWGPANLGGRLSRD